MNEVTFDPESAGLQTEGNVFGQTRRLPRQGFLAHISDWARRAFLRKRAVPKALDAPYQAGSDQVRSLPLSIQPDPKYYVVTNSSPLDRICRVINSSNGGVIGVTGERGAGKSVLLNKVAERYSAMNLTVSLAAPVSAGREMDFFLMLFRHLTQRVIIDLEARVERIATDIGSVGQQVLRSMRIRRQLAAVVTCAVVFLLFITATGAYLHKVRRDYLSDYLTFVTTGRGDFRSSSTYSDLPPESRERARERAQEWEQRRQQEIAALTAELKELDSKSWPWIPQTRGASLTSIISLTSLISLIGVFAMVLALLLARKRWNLNSRNPDEVGLLSYARRLASRLDYELTRTSEVGFEAAPVSWIKAATKRGFQETARPLSLPEITLKYIDFIDQVLKVFPDKVIITIDELDKVSDISQVSLILREIKGALYVRGTYYILSMANDALRSFEGRLGDQRDIFESTFDDVFVVRHLGLATCTEILANRLHASLPLSTVPSTSPAERALQVVAIFSAGNARDLIRGFRDWILERAEESAWDAQHAWRVLFTGRLESISDRASSLVLTDDVRQGLEKILIEFIGGGKSSENMHYQLAAFRESLNTGTKPATDEQIKSNLRLLRYVTEIQILLNACIFVVEAPPATDTAQEADILMRAYQRLPSAVEADRLMASLRSVADQLRENQCGPPRPADRTAQPATSSPPAERLRKPPPAAP